MKGAGKVVASHGPAGSHVELSATVVGCPALSAVNVADLVAEEAVKHPVKGMCHGDHFPVQDAAGIKIHVLAG